MNQLPYDYHMWHIWMCTNLTPMPYLAYVIKVYANHPSRTTCLYLIKYMQSISTPSTINVFWKELQERGFGGGSRISYGIVNRIKAELGEARQFRVESRFHTK